MEKTQKRLSRTELLQLLAKTSEINEALATENEMLKKALAERPELPSTLKVGSIAEAALVANSYFESAQHAADDYLREIKRLRDRLVEKNASAVEMQEQLQAHLRQARENAEADAQAFEHLKHAREYEAAARESEARAHEADMRANKASEQLKRIQSELFDTHERYESLQADLCGMQQQCEEAQAQLQDAQQVQGKLESQINDAQRIYEDLQLQISNAQARHDGMQAQFDSARAQANDEANAIVSEARKKAESIVVEANQRAREIVVQANRQAEEASKPSERSDNDMLTEKIMRRGRHARGGYQMSF